MVNSATQYNYMYFSCKNQNKVPPDWKIRPRIEHPALDFQQTEKEKRNTYSVNVN